MIILAVIVALLVIGAYFRGAKMELNGALFFIAISSAVIAGTCWGLIELAEKAPAFVAHWAGKMLLIISAGVVVFYSIVILFFTIAQGLAICVAEFIIWGIESVNKYAEYREAREAIGGGKIAGD